MRDRFRRVCRLLAISASVALAADDAFTQTRRTLIEIDQAWAALRIDDCESAWNILWPLAKSGNVEARYHLYGAVVGKIVPPGVTKDPSSSYRHTLALSAYAALRPREDYDSGTPSDGRFTRIDVPATIRALKVGEDGERVVRCYTSSSTLQSCLDFGGVTRSHSDFRKLRT